MESPNVLGYVIEVEENRALTPVASEHLDGQNPLIKELVPGPVTVRLKLRLKNTLGKIREVWVEGPPDIVDFYSSEIPPKHEEILSISDIPSTRIEV